MKINNTPDFVRKNMAKLYGERIARGLSRKDLQGLSGVSAYMIRLYEDGKHMPQRRSYNALAEIFIVADVPANKVNFMFRFSREEKAASYGLSIRKLLAEAPYGEEGRDSHV